MEYRYTVLTKREKEEIIKSLFSERNLIKDFSLTEMEIEEIKKISRSYLGLGYAIQLLFLKNRGISIISSHELISEQILKYVDIVKPLSEWYEIGIKPQKEKYGRWKAIKREERYFGFYDANLKKQNHKQKLYLLYT